MMKPVLTYVGLALVLTAAAVAAAGAAVAERSQVAEAYKWNLTDLFASTESFDATRRDVADLVPGLEAHKGRLGQSAQTLLAGLEAVMGAYEKLDRLQTYAHQLHDEDTRLSANLEQQQAIEELGVRLSTATSYLRPEILAIGAEKVAAFVASEPRLVPYRPFLDDILRWAPHTLSPAEERLVARAGELTEAGHSAHSIFTNADLPYPELTLSSGEKVRLDASGYSRYRALPKREDRVRVFEAFWDSYGKFTRTLGTTLYTQVRAHLFEKDVHRFGSSLEAALFRGNIPPAVYRQLIADARRNLPTLHRYLRLRQRMLGLPDLAYHDIYAPLVSSVNLSYTPEESMRLTLEAFAPLGPDYVGALRQGYEQRWVDWLPSTGKRSGAYSTGAYGVHPYQLLNFNGQYDDLSTLAHESGHSMHTFLSDRNQPYVTHDYSIFVAEVASTLNEKLLLQYMLDHTQDDAVRLSLLGEYLDTLRGTLFRQAQFAEFELAIHEKAEGGETLSGENLTKLYLELVRAYYGHDGGVCRVDERYGVEWAYIPHFYYDFYVYQYATSLTASISLANGIIEETKKGSAGSRRRDAYLKLLSSGSSKYPIDLLRDAGVDMTTSVPFEAAMREMNAVMDEMETILARQPQPKKP